MKKKFILVMAVLLCLLTACAAPQEQEQEDTTPKEKEVVRFGILKGPTGIGASYLLEQNVNDAARNKYEVTLEADAQNIIAAVVSNQLDIAAVPTNAASALYNKTEGQVQILALNTAGVLYILEKGNTVASWGDLKGKTIYATGQGANPEYVLNYLLAQNGLTVGEDVTVEFLDSAELTTKAASGEVDVCMLPVPAVTTVLVKNADMRIALNLSEEWDKLNNGSMLTMGCVVVRKEFLSEHPEAVANFLAEYEESINYVKNNAADAGALCEKFEIVPAAAIATKAIPDANLIFVKGADIRPAIEGYYNVLFEADPKSIGGKLPQDDFYPAE
ncbi:MAG: ABC transporter substrate-binding protein [Erysipelotrichaceae bacterium]|nr:ABC transporter substrate-binding protein [Erysipelotrichaceae bacterium]